MQSMIRTASIVAALFSLLFWSGCKPPNPVEEVFVATTDAESSTDTLPEVDPADWPWWRGPTLDNKSSSENPPTQWSDDKNIVWKADVPGRGHGSPALWQQRVYLATADEEAETLKLLCYQRDDGTLLWDTPIHSGGFMHRHNKNSHASGTPACDGQRVYAAFMVRHEDQDGIWVTATDLKGKIVWQTLAGPFTSKHGYGSSVLLEGSNVIVNGDNGESGFLAALDRATGAIRWRVQRPQLDSFASPVVAEIGGRRQLLIHGAGQVTSYDPASGEERWHCAGPAETCANTIVWDDSRVYASGGWPEKELMAIRADGNGDVTGTHVQWQTGKSISYVPSMLIHEGRLFVVNDQGIATCYEAATGDVLWTKRLGGNFSASLTLAAGMLYIPDEAGVMHVFEAADSYRKVAQNDLGDGGFASPVIVEDQIFLRTNHHLYRIGESKSPGKGQ
jgi:outer membrane protein assembly factor BamB